MIGIIIIFVSLCMHIFSGFSWTQNQEGVMLLVTTMECFFEMAIAIFVSLGRDSKVTR